MQDTFAAAREIDCGFATHREQREKVENQAECKIPFQLHVRLWLRIA